MKFSAPCQHSSWRHLLRDLTSKGPARSLKAHKEGFLRTVLVAPVTLARWIVEEQSQLLERESLHIVIAGASKGLDSIDEGRWYQYVPTLLGRPAMRVSVSLVGPELAPGKDHPSLRTDPARAGILTSVAGKLVAGLPAASVTADTLAAWTAARNEMEAMPDLCFAFHPGFEAFGGSWLSQQEGFGKLHMAGVPIGCTSSGIEEFWQDHWLLRQHGGAIRGTAKENPFALERDNLKFTGRWAALCWTLSSEVPLAGFFPNKAELVRFYLAMDMAKPGFSISGNAVFGFIGGVVPVQSESSGERITLVGLPAGVLLCLESGQVLAQTPSGNFQLAERVDPVPLEYLAEFPGIDSDPVERFIWACEMFRGYVEPVLLLTGSHAVDSYDMLLGQTNVAANEHPLFSHGSRNLTTADEVRRESKEQQL
jgi:hypothetical protein